MTRFGEPNNPVTEQALVPERLSFKALHEAVQGCRACELWEHATQAVMGDRGRPMESDLAPLVMVTTHPSAILRQRDDKERADAMDAFVADLDRVACWLAENESP